MKIIWDAPERGSYDDWDLWQEEPAYYGQRGTLGPFRFTMLWGDPAGYGPFGHFGVQLEMKTLLEHRKKRVVPMGRECDACGTQWEIETHYTNGVEEARLLAAKVAMEKVELWLS